MKTTHNTFYITISGILVTISALLFIGSTDPKTGFPEPIEVDGQIIEFTWTDDNTDENLIIYTDKATYSNGIAHADVYVAVENRSGVDQEIELMGHFRESKQRISNISVLTETTESKPEYSVTQKCDGEPSLDNCLDTQEQIGTTIIIKKVWQPLALLERSNIEKVKESSRLSNQLTKSVEGFISNNKSSGFLVPKDGVVYYKVVVEFPTNDSDNFYFETIGNQGGYGHLDPWFNASWTYRVAITVDDTKVPSTQTSFPVYVDLSDLPAEFHTNVKGDGCDIRVVEADETTETAFDLVTYASSTDTGELHFMADSLTGSGGGDTVFYIYYGNAAASCYAVGDTYGRNAVWTGASAVWHLDNVNDASGNSKTLTNENSNTFVAAQLTNGGSQGTSNTNKRFIIADVLGFTKSTDFTMKGLVKLNTAATGLRNLFDVREQTTDHLMYIRTDDPSGVFTVLGGYASNGIGANDISYAFTMGTSNFHHLAVTKSGTTLSLLINGNVVGTTTTSSFANGVGLTDASTLGASGNGFIYSSAIFDQIVYDNIAYSNNWIKAEANNQLDPGTFYTVGAQETDGGGGGGASPDGGLIWFD